METVRILGDSVQMASSIAIIAFVVFYFVFRENFRELQREQMKKSKR
jgi:hypothetical protein